MKGEYIDRCLNSLVHPTDFGADFILDKIVRFQQIVEQISEKLPAPSEVDCGKAFTISINHEMQSIRNQLNMLFANMAREHRQFGKHPSLVSPDPSSLYSYRASSDSQNSIVLGHEQLCLSPIISASVLPNSAFRQDSGGSSIAMHALLFTSS